MFLWWILQGSSSLSWKIVGAKLTKEQEAFILLDFCGEFYDGFYKLMFGLIVVFACKNLKEEFMFCVYIFDLEVIYVPDFACNV